MGSILFSHEGLDVRMSYEEAVITSYEKLNRYLENPFCEHKAGFDTLRVKLGVTRWETRSRGVEGTPESEETRNKGE